MNNIFDSRNPSVMNHDFSKIPHAEIGRSVFRRPFTHKTTFDAGWLIPVFHDEVYPGDTFTLDVSTVARLATPIVPIMDNMILDYHFFFVPNRLVWNHWQNFMGERAEPDDTTEYLIPYIEWVDDGNAAAGSIYDYMGIPVDLANMSDLKISALPFRGMNLIWNEWFRDQNLQDTVPVEKGDGPDAYTNYTLMKRGKRHDYFTSALPWPQKNDTGVQIPLGTVAPVITGVDRTWTGTEAGFRMWDPTNGTYMATGYNLGVASAVGQVGANTNLYSAQGTTLVPSNLWAELSQATAATINSLREAFQLQRLLERDARGGTRYTEILLSHFGVTSPDARLQRPEYLGGGSVPIIIHSIPQQSNNTNDRTPIGTMSAYGFGARSGVGFSKAFVEHGMVFGFISARADLTYQRGLNRMWSRRTKYDFYWPALAHLGEQEILTQELMCEGIKAQDEAVWGYQERWAELRYKPSMITGLMRSTHPQSLDIWHLSQDFGSVLPSLDATFIQEDPPVDRVIAVPAQPHFIYDAYFDLKCARPMPMYSVPGLIDHF